MLEQLKTDRRLQGCLGLVIALVVIALFSVCGGGNDAAAVQEVQTQTDSTEVNTPTSEHVTIRMIRNPKENQ